MPESDCESKYDFSTFGLHYPKTANPSNTILNFSPFLTSPIQETSHFAISTTFVLVRGIFGTWMPGHFLEVLKGLKARRFQVFIANLDTVGGVEKNAEALKIEIHRRVPPDQSIVFLCHSKGGLDALAALASDPQLQKRTQGIVLVQTPRFSSKVLESILLKKHQESLNSRFQRGGEALTRFALKSLGWTEGPLDLTQEPMEKTIEKIDRVHFKFPVLSLVSWSISPSSWTDSFHKRLSQIQPQTANDGQFYLEDLIWPNFHRLGLGNLDHAQPVMGGLGFDAAHLWLKLIEHLGTHLGNG